MQPGVASRWFAALCAGGLLLAGCSGSDSGDAPTPTVSGQTSQRLSGATVCLDLNGDLVCGEGEPTALTDATGAYRLPATEAQAGSARVLVLVTETTRNLDDSALDGVPYLLTAPAGYSGFVSAFTTLMALLDLDEAAIRSAFDLRTDESPDVPHFADVELATLEQFLLPLYVERYRQEGSADLAAQLVLDEEVENILILQARHSEVLADLLPPENLGSASDDVIGEGQFVGVPMNDAFQFGRGLNEVTLEILPGTMAMAEIPTAKNIQSNNTFDYYFHVISRVEDLVDALSINAELGLNMKMISGTAYGSYINDVETHANSIFALITVEAKTYYYDITGLAFANAQDDPANYYPACNSGAAHLGDARYKYLCDYDAFSEIYGHRYLAGIQAGGRYVGLMRIDATSASSARDIAVDVKGRYNNGVIDVTLKGSFSDHVASMARKYNASFKVFTTGAAFDMPSDTACNQTTGGTAGSDVTQGGTGCANGYLIDNPEKFFTYANQFVEAVLAENGDCKNKDLAWQECAYTASFADYSAIAGEARDAAKKERLNQAAQLMAYYRQYKKLRQKAAEIYAHNLDYLYQYTIFNFDTFRDERITVRPDITGIVNGYSTRAMEILEARYAECLQGITCGMPWFNEASQIPIYAPSRLESSLPIPAQPSPASCYDWQKTTGKDGNWALIEREDGTSERYRIRCENMSSNDPETYLDLTNNNSPTAASPMVNFSEWENADQSTTTTIFKHLRIHPNVGKVAVVQGQSLWTETLV